MAKATLRRKAPASRRQKTLRPVHPNAGIEAAYRKQLTGAVDEMHRSIMRFVVASYRKQEPRITVLAQDERPADVLRRTIKELSRRWLRKFDNMADRLADHFAQSIERRSGDALRKILKDGGWTVEFQLTPAMRDIMAASIQENVALIKSIPRQYLDQVEGIVMRGVQVGRDIGQISKDLEQRLGVTKRRAALIARDQSEKTTSAFVRARHLELGITEAIWVHSGGGKHPRPSHLKAGRERVKYDVAKGWLDPDEGKHIHPGELINCRCVSKPVVPGFS